MAVRIGELLLREERVTPAQIAHALEHQSSTEAGLAASLVQLGYVADEDLTGLLSREYGVPWVDLSRVEVDPATIRQIPADTAHRYKVLPLARAGATLTVALTEPTNVFAIDDIRFMTGCHVEPVLASETAMRHALTRYYPSAADGDVASPAADWNNASRMELVTRALEQSSADSAADVELVAEMEQIDVDALEREGTQAPVIRMVNLMLMSAMQRGASDIHVEPYEKELRVRFRVDGILQHVMAPPLRLRDAITSRIKIMARLDIAEKRLPQDGRMKVRFAAAEATQVIDVRVSALPTLFGEKLVLRLLDRRTLQLDMTKLGLEPEALRTFQAAVARPWGMVLVTGPTGSGKTSTLYSAIAGINAPGTNIVTAEDPIEFNLTGVNQVQVREHIGLGFATVLRAVLRQDPNVILVGEIRDAETAGIAVKAALTGHLVLSTLHTNDAPSTIARLVNMGIAPFLVAGSVSLICAQRLVRRICTECAGADRCDPQVLREAGFTDEDARHVVPRRGAGCPRCNQTGYAGRVGLYEVMAITDSLRELILLGASGAEVRRAAVAEGMVSLRQSGLRKIRDGITTLDEVVRETVS